MIWLLAAPVISKTVKAVAAFVASLVIVILMGAPLLGWYEQPWSRWWFGQNTSGLPVIGPTPITVPATGGSTTVALPTPTVAPIAITPRSLVAQVIAEAMTWLGVRYLWGGCSRTAGTDCSCFVQTAWAVVGVHLPRTTVPQMASLPPVPRDQIQPGDLVFFRQTCSQCGADPTHVGLAIGNGQMIEAGDPVQIASYTSGFYAAHYMGAGRPHG